MLRRGLFAVRRDRRRSASSATSTTVPSGRPVASGSVTAVSGSSMSVESSFSGTTSVQWTSSTTFSQTVSATAQDVTVGSCVDRDRNPARQRLGGGPDRGALGRDQRDQLPVPAGRWRRALAEGDLVRAAGDSEAGGGGGFGGAAASGEQDFRWRRPRARSPRSRAAAVTLTGTGRIVGSSGTSSVGSSSQPAQVEVSTSSSTIYTKVEAASRVCGGGRSMRDRARLESSQWHGDGHLGVASGRPGPTDAADSEARGARRPASAGRNTA